MKQGFKHSAELQTEARIAMIDERLLSSLGLSDEQKRSILEAVEAERVYQSLLCAEGIAPSVSQKIVKATEFREVRGQSEELLMLKIRESWKDFIRVVKRDR